MVIKAKLRQTNNVFLPEFKLNWTLQPNIMTQIRLLKFGSVLPNAFVRHPPDGIRNIGSTLTGKTLREQILNTLRVATPIATGGKETVGLLKCNFHLKV